MFKRVEIEGFKSLHEASLDLAPLTAVVGVNGSGKSNLVEALELLARLATEPLEQAFKHGRGTIAEQFSRSASGERSSTMKFAAEFDAGETVGASGYTCRYVIEIEHRQGDASGSAVARIAESLDVPGEWSAHRFPGDPTVFYRRKSRPSDLVTSRASPPRDMALVLLSKQPAVFPLAPELDVALWALQGGLRGLSVLQFDLGKLRDSSDPDAEPILARDGGNLPTTFGRLGADERAQVCADLADLVPGLRDVAAVRGSDDLLGLRFDFDGQSFPARLVSDGTLRMLAVLTRARGALPGATTVFEEPENGVHPASLRRLISKLMHASQRGGQAGRGHQFVLTSHSPAVVAALAEQPRALVFAKRVHRGDGVRTTRLLPVRSAGAPSDYGRTTASPAEIGRFLETVASVEHVE